MGAVANKAVSKRHKDMEVKVKVGDSSERSLKVDLGRLNKAELLALLPKGVAMEM